MTGLALRAFDLERAVNVETVEQLAIALGAWAEAANPDTYFDRWQNLNSKGQALSIASGVFAALGVGLLVPGVVLTKQR